MLKCLELGLLVVVLRINLTLCDFSRYACCSFLNLSYAILFLLILCSVPCGSVLYFTAVCLCMCAHECVCVCWVSVVKNGIIWD